MATLSYGSWTYTGNPALSDRDWVRFAIGDTQDDDQLVTDEEIAAAVSDAGSKPLAAIRICEYLAARFSREADITTNDGAGNSRTKALSQRAAAFLKLADKLRENNNLATAVIGMPYAGGISIGDKDTRELDTDRVSPAFTVGMSDYQ